MPLPLSRLSRLLLAGGLAICASGCGRYYDIGRPESPRNGTFAWFAPGGRYRGATLILSTDEPAPPAHVYASNVYYVGGAAPAPLPPRSSRDVERARAELPPFDPQAARVALSEVDLSSCREVLASRGWGHARVTFNPDGTASKVIIDEPSDLSPDAVTCIGRRIGASKVAPFSGSLITMGTTFHVR